MLLSECLDKISKEYIPGVVSYYSRKTPDPWQRAHDSMEKTMIMFSRKDNWHLEMGVAVDNLHRECMRLISDFKKLNPETQRVDVSDSFFIGDPVKVDKLSAIADHCCTSCSSDKNIRMIKNQDGVYGIYCTGCVS